MPSIPPHQRKSEEELRNLTEELRPRILGSLLNLVALSLANQHTITTPELPRMADFAKRIISIETYIGWEEGTFLSYYKGMIEAASKQAMEGNIVLQSIIKLMEKNDYWEGTAQKLIDHITTRTSPDKRRQLPAVNKLELNRLKPGLSLHKISVEQRKTSEARFIIFKKIDNAKNEENFVEEELSLEELLTKPL